jgi:hypothetical protein
MAKKTLAEMRADHRRYGHLQQAQAIAASLSNRFPALKISGPEETYSGKYITVSVTLVPGLVFMCINLSSSGLNQHSYNLQPASDRIAEAFDPLKEVFDLVAFGVDGGLGRHAVRRERIERVELLAALAGDGECGGPADGWEAA